MTSLPDVGNLATATLSDALDRLGRPGSLLGIAPLQNGQRLVGRAFTVRYRPAGHPPGTVGDYLDAQGLAPYFAMGDRYGVVYDRMVDLLERLAPAESERRAERRAEVDEMDAGAVATSFFDVDATVADYCRARGLTVPTDVAGLIDFHIRAITAWLDELEARLQQGQ